MFLFNKKTPKRINFNGFHVAEVIYNGITVWTERILTLISGKAPLTLDASIGEDVIDYQIYGESVQEATPSLTIPVEVECVGDYDEASGKYIIPITVKSDNQEPITTNIYLDKPLCKIGSYADYIDFENKKVIRQVGIQEFDENDANSFGVYALANRDFYGFSKTIPDMKEGKFQKGLSTYFYNQEAITSRIWFGSASVNNLVYFSIPEVYNAGTTTSARRQALAEWFKGLKKPFIIYYILATPTEKTIELPDIPTFKGKTIIEVNTNITPNIAIEYYKQGG